MNEKYSETTECLTRILSVHSENISSLSFSDCTTTVIE